MALVTRPSSWAGEVLLSYIIVGHPTSAPPNLTPTSVLLLPAPAGASCLQVRACAWHQQAAAPLALLPATTGSWVGGWCSALAIAHGHSKPSPAAFQISINRPNSMSISCSYFFGVQLLGIQLLSGRNMWTLLRSPVQEEPK